MPRKAPRHPNLHPRQTLRCHKLLPRHAVRQMGIWLSLSHEQLPPMWKLILAVLAVLGQTPIVSSSVCCLSFFVPPSTNSNRANNVSIISPLSSFLLEHIFSSFGFCSLLGACAFCLSSFLSFLGLSLETQISDLVKCKQCLHSRCQRGGPVCHQVASLFRKWLLSCTQGMVHSFCCSWHPTLLGVKMLFCDVCVSLSRMGLLRICLPSASDWKVWRIWNVHC